MKTRLKAHREEKDSALTYLNGKYRVRLELDKTDVLNDLKNILSDEKVLEYNIQHPVPPLVSLYE